MTDIQTAIQTATVITRKTLHVDISIKFLQDVLASMINNKMASKLDHLHRYYPTSTV